MDVAGLVQRAADKAGFVRERQDERRLPTDPSNITVMPFFGDLRSLFVLSSLLLKRFREEERGSKYFILASWPGFGGLFPYVNEYWGLGDESQVTSLYAGATQFHNRSEGVFSYYRTLNQYFFEDVVVPHEQFADCYGEGIRDGFWKKYREVVRFLPAVPSSALLSKEFVRDLNTRGGFKVFLYPAKVVQHWRLGDVHGERAGRDFWAGLAKRLAAERITPVVYRGALTHDLSEELGDRCIYFSERDVLKVLSAMRVTGCVLDVFTGVSRLALAARCPFLMVDERSRAFSLRESELDLLCGPGVPRQYIYTFPTILEGGPDHWGVSLFDGLVNRLGSFLPALDRDRWPTTGESCEAVSYEPVRRRKLSHIGAGLLRKPGF